MPDLFGAIGAEEVLPEVIEPFSSSGMSVSSILTRAGGRHAVRLQQGPMDLLNDRPGENGAGDEANQGEEIDQIH